MQQIALVKITKQANKIVYQDLLNKRIVNTKKPKIKRTGREHLTSIDIPDFMKKNNK